MAAWRVDDVVALTDDLAIVLWIGGGSGAGKSTIAHALAERHGLSVYSSDGTMLNHARRTSADAAPQLHRFLAMSMDQRWLHQDPQTMTQTFHWYRGEAFECIVDDLKQICRSTPGVVAEGFRLLPKLVAPLLTSPNSAVWLLPTPEFREMAFRARGTTWSIASRTSDPQRALDNLLERDKLFTERLHREAGGLQLSTLTIDGSLDAEGTIELTERALGLKNITDGAAD